MLQQNFHYLGYYQIERNLCGETRLLSVSLLNLSIPSLSSDFRLVSEALSFLLFLFSFPLRKVGVYVIICVKVSAEKVAL